ncbi:hypothetical protein TNCT_492061 [Trichonephila clavata]|uniref:Uncharacterized protein n=1 Tax=Trichonephila clavata TaxID=2740835 RepID=A0A8X6LWR6_TRICU|nr:hypothetical protein TNCT_492061 [Trichonephila clavata]
MAVATLFHYRLGPEILKVQEGVCGYDERWIVLVVLLFFWNFSKNVEVPSNADLTCCTLTDAAFHSSSLEDSQHNRCWIKIVIDLLLILVQVEMSLIVEVPGGY